MHREGISTPRARQKGWQPLIECVQRDFRIIFTFPFLFFLGLTRVLPLLLRILRCMTNLDLRSSLSLNVCVLN